MPQHKRSNFLRSYALAATPACNENPATLPTATSRDSFTSGSVNTLRSACRPQRDAQPTHLRSLERRWSAHVIPQRQERMHEKCRHHDRTTDQCQCARGFMDHEPHPERTQHGLQQHDQANFR
jgi:hypothetical protein